MDKSARQIKVTATGKRAVVQLSRSKATTDKPLRKAIRTKKVMLST